MRPKLTSSLLKALVITCSGIALSVHAHGQDDASIESDAADRKVLDAVTVTSTKRAVSARDLPYNVSAVTGETVERLGIADVADLSKIAPGVNVVDAGVRTGFRSSGINIRGLAIDNTGFIWSPAKNDPTIGMYVNDTPLFANLQLMDIERIEVLRGPQGTLYGSGAMGGNVRYVLQKPNADGIEGQFKGGLSSTEDAGDLNYELSGVVNFPVTDRLSVRLNAKYAEEAGFMDYTNLYVLTGSPGIDPTREPVLADPTDIVNSPPLFTSQEDADNSDALFFRAAARYEGDNFDILLSYLRQEVSADTSPMYQAQNDDDDTFSEAIQLIPFDGETDLLSLEMEFDVGFATLTSATSYTDSLNRGLHEETPVYTRFSFYPAYYGSSPRPLINDLSVRDQTNFSQEVRLTSNGGGAFDWLAGIFYTEMEGETTVRQFFPGYDEYANACFVETGTFGGVPCGYGTLLGIYEENGGVPIVQDLAYLSDFQDEFTEIALFGEATYHFTDTWQVTGGARVFEQTYDVAEQGGLLFVPGFVSSATASEDYSDSLFKLNTSWEYMPEHQVYATWSQGFRRGGRNALGALATPDTEGFDPDEIENFEVGVKGLIDGRFEYTLSAFTIDWTDIQLRASCTNLALICNVNGGDATTEGIEAEIAALITDNLQINAGLSLTDASLDDPQGFLVGRAQPGARLPGSPEQSGNVSAFYERELSNGLVLGATGSITYAGDRVTDAIATDAEVLSSYTLVDGSISLSNGSWTATLFVNNLTNERARISQLPSRDEAGNNNWGPEAPAIARRPRTIGVSVGYNF